MDWQTYLAEILVIAATAFVGRHVSWRAIFGSLGTGCGNGCGSCNQNQTPRHSRQLLSIEERH